MASTGNYTCDPANRPVDAVRVLIGDTDCPFCLKDKEIQFFIDTEGATNYAAASAADALCAKFARKVTYKAGGQTVNQSDIFGHYKALASRLRSRGNEQATFYSGGQSFDEKRSDRDDTDLVPPTFFRGMHDNPEAAQRGDDETLGFPF